MQISKAAMLVSVNVINGGLLGERRDAVASKLVTDTYNTQQNRTKASKYLIDRTVREVKNVIAYSQRLREVVYRYTLPWGNEKMRLLPIKTADEFRIKVAQAQLDLDEVREEYIQLYPSLVLQSEIDLASLFDRSQYPSPDRVRTLFRTNVVYWPMPESNHFIAEISDNAAKEAKENIEREIEERLIEASSDMVRRAKEVVTKFVDKLEKFRIEADGKPNIIFRDSIVDNIADTANLIDRMNLTDNPQIKKVVLDLKRLTQFAPAALRQVSSNPNYQGADIRRQKALTAGQEVLINLAMLDLKDQEVSDMVADASDYMDM